MITKYIRDEYNIKGPHGGALGSPKGSMSLTDGRTWTQISTGICNMHNKGVNHAKSMRDNISIIKI